MLVRIGWFDNPIVCLFDLVATVLDDNMNVLEYYSYVRLGFIEFM